MPTCPSVTSTSARSRPAGSPPAGPVSRSSALVSGAAISVPPRAPSRERNSTAWKRAWSPATCRPSPSSGGASIALSKASSAKRSRPVSPSTIRATARRAATIFQPPMLPDRSSTNTRSLGVTTSVPTGGSRVRAKVPCPPSASSAAVTAVETADEPVWSRSTKSRLARSPGSALTVLMPSRSSSTTVCRLDRTAPSSRPAGSIRTLIDRSTGFGKPGSSTGGVILEASGTASVSGSVPDPTGSPSSGAPGM